MREDGLIYMWRNRDSPGDAAEPGGRKHSDQWVIDTFGPYFTPLNGTWPLNPEVNIDPVSLVEEGRWKGRIDLLVRRPLPQGFTLPPPAK